MRFKRVPISGEAIVVAFDMCSSTDILEELILRHDLSPYNRVISKLKHYLSEAQESVLFDPYKFTGDGWILLFPGATPASSLWQVITGLSACYRATSESVLLPRLNTQPAVHGLTYGIDAGPIARMTIFQQWEYVGRPIAVACRLQAAVQGVIDNPAYRALVSGSCFNDHFSGLGVQAINKKVSLRNIRAGRTFQCKLVRSNSAKTRGRI